MRETDQDRKANPSVFKVYAKRIKIEFLIACFSADAPRIVNVKKVHSPAGDPVMNLGITNTPMLTDIHSNNV